MSADVVLHYDISQTHFQLNLHELVDTQQIRRFWSNFGAGVESGDLMEM